MNPTDRPRAGAFSLLSLILLWLWAPIAAQAQTQPQTMPVPLPPGAVEGDVTLRDFAFRSGERLETLRLHYLTLGTPKLDAKGHVTNAVMILHGTGGTGRQFLAPIFADVLFKAGGLLDPAKWYVILPDGIGHGGSSKPSDGLRMRFPKYDYDDMVAAQYRLMTEGLKVDHLRLILGTSMGCMHAFVWGETYPDAMDALMPLACLPVEIAGRNRLWRAMSIDAIRKDPDWKNGDYERQPEQGLRASSYLSVIAGSAPLFMQSQWPTRAAVEAAFDATIAARQNGVDANDRIYQLDASRTYDPSADLDKIKARVVWINSADDFINPPELGIAQRMAPRLKNGTFELLPITPETRGHGTHTKAAIWQDRLATLIAETGGAP